MFCYVFFFAEKVFHHFMFVSGDHHYHYCHCGASCQSGDPCAGHFIGGQLNSRPITSWWGALFPTDRHTYIFLYYHLYDIFSLDVVTLMWVIFLGFLLPVIWPSCFGGEAQKKASFWAWFFSLFFFLEKVNAFGMRHSRCFSFGPRHLFIAEMNRKNHILKKWWWTTTQKKAQKSELPLYSMIYLLPYETWKSTVIRPFIVTTTWIFPMLLPISAWLLQLLHISSVIENPTYFLSS